MRKLGELVYFICAFWFVPFGALAEVGHDSLDLSTLTEVEVLDFSAEGIQSLSVATQDIERITLLQSAVEVAGAFKVLKVDRRAADGSVVSHLATAGTLTVKIPPSVSSNTQSLAALENKLGGDLEPLGFDLFALTLDNKNTNTISSALVTASSLPEVIYAELDYLVFPASQPSDPLFGSMWHLSNTGQTGGTSGADVGALNAWSVTTGDDDVIVSVIDTGIDYSHADLTANIWINPLESGLDSNGKDKRSNGVDDDSNGYIDDWQGWDFANDDNDPMDDHSHGTHVAGTIAAASNNALGVAGVAWKAKLIPIKFLGPNGGTTQNAIRAIAYSSQTPAFASNNSWGGGGFSQALFDAIKGADQLFLAAAGNHGGNNDRNPYYPSSYKSPLVFSVAATDHNDQLTGFSGSGAKSVDIGAPGAHIRSTILNDSYGLKSGTSMATPVVAGVAVLVKAQNPRFSPEEVKDRIMASSKELASLNGKTKSGGRVDAAEALKQSVSNQAPVGSVVAYLGSLSDIPVNWVLADGRRVVDIDSPLHGQDLPDLRGGFIMGASRAHPVGTRGGTNRTENHAHQVGLSTSNVWFARKSGNGYAMAYHPVTRAQGFDTSLRELTAPSDASNPYDTHGHMNGRASVRGVTAPGGAHDNRPAFVALNYIIRIK